MPRWPVRGMCIKNRPKVPKPKPEHTSCILGTGRSWDHAHYCWEYEPATAQGWEGWPDASWGGWQRSSSGGMPRGRLTKLKLEVWGDGSVGRRGRASIQFSGHGAKTQIPGALISQCHLPVRTKSVRDPVSEKQGGWLQKNTCDWPLTSTPLRIHMHLHTHKHTHT